MSRLTPSDITDRLDKHDKQFSDFARQYELDKEENYRQHKDLGTKIDDSALQITKRIDEILTAIVNRKSILIILFKQLAGAAKYLLDWIAEHPKLTLGIMLVSGLVGGTLSVSDFESLVDVARRLWPAGSPQ